MVREVRGWWAERWLSYLQSHGVGPESEGQLRSALRAEGQVSLRKGRLSARVWVSERRQVEATVRVRPWTEREWRRAVESMAQSPELAQRLLSGTMGAELEEALAAQALSLFPAPGPGAVRCTCQSSTSTCRHLNYLALQTAEMLDGNPFLWLEVLGRTRQELLAELKGRISDQASPVTATGDGEVALTAPDEGGPLDPARFWEGRADPWAIPVRPVHGAAPDGLIRSLGPLPVSEALYLFPSREPLAADELLRRMVVQVARTASSQALGEAEPSYGSKPAPGKVVSLAARLLPEVVEALRDEEEIMPIEVLVERCPTARTLGEEAVRRPLQEACALLPPDLITIGGRYVGSVGALLQGASFRHVVTLSEWAMGEAESDADWVRALAAVNRPRPVLAPWFERLEPEVGDELQIDLGDGGLQVSLRRRAKRNMGEVLHSDAIASRLLQMLAGMTHAEQLTEQEGVALLLAEGVYRGDLQPDPLWLVPLLGPGLYLDPAERAVTRHPNTWQPGFPRFVYGNWKREQAVMGFQARMMKRGASRREIEAATACVTWWCRLWPGAQDQPGAAESLGPFLHFLWNVAPREAARHRVAPEQVPVIMEQWFAFLEESHPAVVGGFTHHQLACGLLDHYADRCRTVPAEGAGEGAVIAWQAEGFRWMGPAHYLSLGGYY